MRWHGHMRWNTLQIYLNQIFMAKYANAQTHCQKLKKKSKNYQAKSEKIVLLRTYKISRPGWKVGVFLYKVNLIKNKTLALLF